MKKVAFITGASRGIGRATAIAFARAGFDIAISARTLEEGEAFRHSVRDASGNPLRGSLNQTAEVLRGLGADVLVLRMDLLDSDSVGRCAEKVLSYFGRLDLLINNAIYQGNDLNLPVLELRQDTLERVAQAYLISPFLLVQSVLPVMLEQKHGVIINITSGAGEVDPPVPATDGGWGYAYGAGKAAVSRLSGVICREHGNSRISAYTLNPGVVATDTLKATLGEKNLSVLSRQSASPELIAAVLLWLVTDQRASRHQFQTINAQRLADEYSIKPARESCGE